MNQTTFESPFAEGNSLFRQGKYEDAINAYLQAIDRYSAFEPYYVNLSEALLASGKEGGEANAVLQAVTAKGNALVTKEMYSNVKRSRLVNSKWYLEEYKNFLPNGIDAVMHYLVLGWRLGFNPCKRFNTNGYLENNGKHMQRGEMPLLHYLYKHNESSFKIANQKSKKNNELAELAIKLWSGHSITSMKVLREIHENENLDGDKRWSALWQAARWLFFCGHIEEALSYATAMENLPDVNSLRKETVYLKAFCLLALERKGDAAEVLQRYIAKNERDADARFALANAIDNDEERLEVINKAFGLHGFSGIQRKDERLPLSILNIKGESDQEVTEGKKVSIVMPIYCAGHQVRIAIESLLNQTYKNIEIIAVDDCSTDDTFTILQEIEKEDSRVRAIQPSENGGAYAARNYGLKFVTGELITTHDSDDWSHPQKIARQVEYMEQNTSVMGCSVHWVRVRDDLSFTQNWRPVKHIIHWSQSSFMFRREVLETLGGWDVVRVGGDTEYIWRMQAFYGNSSLAKIYPDTPLALALDEDASLTRTKATHVRTVYFGLRHIYREICRWWHVTQSELHISGSESKRIFPAPRNMFERQEGPLVFGAVIAGDFSRLEDCLKAADYIGQCGSEKVALFYWPDFDKTTDSLCNLYFELLRESKVEPVVMGQEIEAKEFYITDKKLLDFPLDGYPEMTGFKSWQPIK
ncbi:glycosyltransferase [Halomonas sp. LS-001]